MEEPLYKLLNRERINNIKSLMSAGKLDVNMKDEKGNTALHEAVIKREPEELIKILLQAGADVNLKNNEGYTALQLFLEYTMQNMQMLDKTLDFTSFLKLFLNCGANVNSHSLNLKMSPLHYAVVDSDMKSIQYLLSQGADLRVKCSIGRTPLHYAASSYKGDTDVIEAILTSDSELLKVVDDYGQTPLHTLANSKNSHVGVAGIVKFLEVFQKYNADMHVRDGDGFRPVDLAIKVACFDNHFDTLEAFLDLGLIEIDGRCNICGKRRLEDHSTILFAACEENSLPLAKYLLKHGANVNAMGEDGMSVLHYVVYQCRGELEYLDLIEYLFKWEPNPATLDVGGNAILSELVELEEQNPILRSVLKYMIKIFFLSLEPPLRRTELMDNLFWGLDNGRGNFWRHYSDCCREIEQMDGDAIPLRDHTFWHLLTGFKGDMLFYLKNLNVVKYLKDIDIPNRYPIYGPEIQKKVDKTLVKLEVYKKSAEALSCCLPPHHNLGDLVINKIISYCKTKELRLLCE